MELRLCFFFTVLYGIALLGSIGLLVISAMKVHDDKLCNTLCKSYPDRQETKCEVPHQLDESPLAIVSIPLNVSSVQFEEIYFRAKNCDVRNNATDFTKEDNLHRLWIIGIVFASVLIFIGLVTLPFVTMYWCCVTYGP